MKSKMITHVQVMTDYGELVGNRIHLTHFINEVGNNGCGPMDVVEFVQDIMAAMVEAKVKHECVVIGSYAGIKDLIVFPDGTFSVIDTHHLKKYKMVEEV